MIRAYVPILFLIGFVILNAIMIVGLSALTMRHRPTPVKQSPYESGIPVLGSARERFSVKFYMVAMLFIIFDVETVYLIPWAVHFRRLSCTTSLVDGFCPAGSFTFFGLGAMLIFIAVLTLGFIYEWKKGALKWD